MKSPNTPLAPAWMQGGRRTAFAPGKKPARCRRSQGVDASSWQASPGREGYPPQEAWQPPRKGSGLPREGEAWYAWGGCRYTRGDVSPPWGMEPGTGGDVTLPHAGGRLPRTYERFPRVYERLPRLYERLPQPYERLPRAY